MQNNLLSYFLNFPDLIIIIILFLHFILGLRYGFLHTLCKLIGKVIALSLAVVSAKIAAPFVANIVVTPIVGSVFEKQAALSLPSALMDTAKQTVTELASKMAESIAFIGIFFLASILFVWLVRIVFKSLKFITKIPPLSILDSVCGGVFGIIAGFVLISLVLIGISWFAPITFTSLGYLSPQLVAKTTLLKSLIEILPVAI